MSARRLRLGGFGRTGGTRTVCLGRGASAWTLGALALFLAIIAATFLGPLLADPDPNALDLGMALREPAAEHPLGTDQLGRDQLARLLIGGRYSLAIAAVGTVGIIALGLVAGAVSGYYGGRLDLLVSALTNALLALPSLLLALAILGTVGPGTGGLLLALIGAGWVGHARLFRAATLTLREQPYIDAAQPLGAGGPRILLRHLLPNPLPTVAVLATLDFGALLLTVSSLSFLGLGVQPPTADWGAMLNEGRPFFGQAPFLSLAPGLCITAVALLSNLLGDALRDLVDRART